jgi:hypothetical protein
MATYHAVMVKGGTDVYPESQLIFKGVVVEMPRGKSRERGSVGPTEAFFGIVASCCVRIPFDREEQSPCSVAAIG